MFNKKNGLLLKSLLFLSCFMMLTNIGISEEIKTILKQADRYRLSQDSMQVKTKIDLYESEQLKQTKEYDVYLKTNRRSLVIFKSAIEQGQKILMIDDSFWMIMPKSQKPIRITPMQKMLGEASTGDIATMTWSEDYDGTNSGKDIVNRVSCLKLDLHSIHKGTTYDRIELYVAEDGYWPVQANLYVTSGKLAKEAYFTLGDINGQKQIIEMKLIDKIQKNRKTIIRYLAKTAREIPDKFYNPMFLVKNIFEN